MASIDQQQVDLSSAIYGQFGQGSTPWRRVRAFFRFTKRNKLGALGLALVAVILFFGIFAPLLQRYGALQSFQQPNPDFNPTATPFDIAANPDKALSSPFILDRWKAPLSSDHWLGTDANGQDIYARLVVGTRLAIIIGVGASAIAVSLGTIVGIISGYFGGKFDLFVQRFVDAIQAFPGLVLLLLIVSVMEKPNLAITVVALGFLGFASSVRIVRSSVLSVSQAAFIEAARSYGATDGRLMLKHILPNIASAVLVIFSISIGVYILSEASLSFLGLGPADKTTWGKMVNAGRQSVDLHPWESLLAGGAITLTVLGFNLAGDAIRDELDPRLRGR